MLIAMAGLPGTGKSTLAALLAQSLPALVLDKDKYRAALFPPDFIEYTTEQDDFCMSIVFQVATYVLQRHPHQRVIIDGRTFSRRYQVETLTAVAARLATPLKILECVCSDEVAFQRLNASAASSSPHLAQNRDVDLYRSLKASREEIRGSKLIVDTGHDLQQCVAQCLTYIRERG